MIVCSAFILLSPRPVFAQHHAVTRTAAAPAAADVARNPADVPPPVGDRPPQVVKVTLTVQELKGMLDPGRATTYAYWTFDGKVPGPMIRVRVGDTVEVTLQNPAASTKVHSLDLHAVLGPGGGATLTQAIPGESKTFTFQATTPGLFIYHCATMPMGEHIANGMFGMILVEPAGGLARVDHEYYVMQSELYTGGAFGAPGEQKFSYLEMLHEQPVYFLFNGAVGELVRQPLQAKVGESVRIFFGDAGPNFPSAFHVTGEILGKVYEQGGLTSPPLTGAQTVGVPPGSAAIVEFQPLVPGRYNLVDHAMARMEQGLLGHLLVTGAENQALFHAGPAAAAAAPATAQGHRQ
ncbi:MAG TPA: copper-containing nitrite reductase [Terriglobales bacterium]|nr:copper-containing nitrite reductase [Terriglobales bacterium]